MRSLLRMSLLAGALAAGGCGGYDVLGPPRARGDLQLNSVPGGAAITLDSQITGSATPSIFYQLAAGAHTVTLSLEGCRDTTFQVTVRADTLISSTVKIIRRSTKPLPAAGAGSAPLRMAPVSVRQATGS